MPRTAILRLLDTYFRHRWLYLIPVGLMAIAGAFYPFSQHLYISSGVIFTERDSLLSSLTSVNQETATWNTPAQDTANQVSQLITTDAFIRAVISETDLEVEMNQGTSVVKETISRVRSHIWVSVTGNNQVQISAADSSPDTAYQLAQSAINNFILWNINMNRTDIVTAEGFFQDLIQNYQANVIASQEALRSYLMAHPEPLRGSRPEIEQFDIRNLQAELDFAGARLDRALEKAEGARLANAQIESNIRQKYIVVDAPEIPNRSATSKRQVAMESIIFLVVGLILSAIAVVGTTLFDQTFRLPEEIPQLLDLPILALLPDASLPVQKRSWKWKRSAWARDAELEASEKDFGVTALVSTKSPSKSRKNKQMTVELPDNTEQAQDQISSADVPASEDDSRPQQDK